MGIKITNESIMKVVHDVENDKKYGSDNKIIEEVLKSFPYNTNKYIVAMKISLIDLTNSTNLSKNLGKDGGLDKLAQKITEINFDDRVEKGDYTLVSELAKWTKEMFNKNLFSFISKYCLYHNYHCYNKDDYVIYDSVISNNIINYITEDEYLKLTNKKLYKSSISNLKKSFDYEKYVDIVNFIIEKNSITLDKPHRKLDWYIWYPNRENK